MSFFDKASEAIWAAGGRVTGQRLILIELLANTSERIDAETLHRLAQERDPRINLATVYRTLNMLEAAHLIQTRFISPNHNRKYFTLVVEPCHFTCRRCHRVSAFASDFVELLKQQLERDFHVQAFNTCVCVEGLCPDCLAQEQRESHTTSALDQRASRR